MNLNSHLISRFATLIVTKYSLKNTSQIERLIVQFDSVSDPLVNAVDGVEIDEWKMFLLRFLKTFQQSESDTYTNICALLNDINMTSTMLPAPSLLFEAFNHCSIGDVKVVIIAQDPYPDRRHAHGLCFSSKSNVVPASLKNIFAELDSSLGIKNTRADLTPWAKQGVLLLNKSLSVEEKKPNSHRDIWGNFTNGIIEALLKHSNHPIVFMLWGRESQKVEDIIKTTKARTAMHVLKWSHPSPRSGFPFVGNQHFVKCNKILNTEGLGEINWRT